ncbi:MAG: hypothetical protein AAF297_09355 [Planctomycetota bacterium]
MRKHPRTRRRAFTLVEGLATATVIGGGLGFSLPMLTANRERVREVVCRQNIGRIAQMHANYALNNQGWIAGSPTTSGWNAIGGQDDGTFDGNAFFNGIAMQSYDFLGPILFEAGFDGPTFDFIGTPGDHADELRAVTFDWYRDGLDILQCPSNDTLARPTDFGVADTIGPFTTGRMLPYNMSFNFTSTTDPSPFGTGGPRPNDRGAYVPNFANVGHLSTKVVTYEGHLFADATTEPMYPIALDANFGAAFANAGPWSQHSKSYSRTDPNMFPGPIQQFFKDRRPLAMRHGTPPAIDQFGNEVYREGGKAHAAFFDGHVSAKTDLEYIDPDLWFPSGSVLNGPSDFWDDARDTYPDKLTGTYVVP